MKKVADLIFTRLSYDSKIENERCHAVYAAEFVGIERPLLVYVPFHELLHIKSGIGLQYIICKYAGVAWMHSFADGLCLNPSIWMDVKNSQNISSK